MSDPVATTPPAAGSASPAAAALGTCGHCKAVVVDSKSLRCAACTKPFDEAGLTPPGGWVRARMLMWYAIGATMIIAWLTPHGRPLQTLLSKTGLEVALRWTPTLLVFALSLMALIQGMRKTKGAAGCGRCGYSTLGLTTLSCPECGSDLHLEGISVGKLAVGAFMRRSPAYTAARWLTLALFSVAITLGVHAFVALPYQYTGSSKISIPLAGPAGTTFTAECTQSLLIDSTAWGTGDAKPRPFPHSYIEVNITSGPSTPILGTLLIGIEEDLMIVGSRRDGPQEPLAPWRLKYPLLKLIPLLTDEEATYSAKRIIMANRPMVTMTFPTTGTSIATKFSAPNITGFAIINRPVERIPPLTIAALALIFVLALIVLNELAIALRKAGARRRTAPIPPLPPNAADSETDSAGSCSPARSAPAAAAAAAEPSAGP